MSMRHEPQLADIVIFEDWKRVARTPSIPHITVIDSTEQLRARLARQMADDYSQPASVRLGQHPTRPTHEPAPIRPNQPTARVRQPQPQAIRIVPVKRDWLEQLATWCWVLLLALIFLTGALTALRMIWP